MRESPGEATGPKENGPQQNQAGKPPVTREKGIGEYRKEPLPWRIDDPASGHPGGVAAQTHAHGEGLLAAGAAPGQSTVQEEGNPGQIPHILQESKEWEKNGHRRQHHSHHPGHGGIDPIQQRAGQRIPRQAPLGSQAGQPQIPAVKQALEKLGGVIGPRDGQPYHHQQKSQHHRKPRCPAGEQPVQVQLPLLILALPPDHHLIRHGLRPPGPGPEACSPPPAGGAYISGCRKPPGQWRCATGPFPGPGLPQWPPPGRPGPPPGLCNPPECSLRSTSSMRLTHTTTWSCRWSTCWVRIRLRSKLVPSQTTTTQSAWPDRMNSSATSSSLERLLRE